MIRVTVWNEYIDDKEVESIIKIYPKGIHGCIAEFLGRNDDYEVRTATLEEENHGLSDEVLESTDVLIWWGHKAHHLVKDEIAAKVKNRVLRGMGLIVLHSGHISKPFVSLMGTSGSLKWRDGDFERLWTVLPGHPIAKDVPEMIELEVEEMYGERFDIPQPDELVFIGWFSGGEVFRSGCCWNRGNGKVFYFQPGHEHNPTYLNPHIQTIIKNAVNWAKPVNIIEKLECPHIYPSYEEKRRQGIK